MVSLVAGIDITAKQKIFPGRGVEGGLGNGRMGRATLASLFFFASPEMATQPKRRQNQL